MKSFKIILLFLLVLLFSCTNIQIKTPESKLIIKVLAIIDSSDNQPIKENSVKLSWIDSRGRIIQSEEYKNQKNLEFEMPADGKTILTITVVAPGYHPWTQEIRAHQNFSKIYEMKVELIPMDSNEIAQND